MIIPLRKNPLFADGPEPGTESRWKKTTTIARKHKHKILKFYACKWELCVRRMASENMLEMWRSSAYSLTHTHTPVQHVSSLLSRLQQWQRRLLVPYSMASDNNDPSKSDLKPLKYATQNETLFHCVYFPFSLYMLSTSLSWYIFHTKKEKRTNAKIINNSAKKIRKT